MTSGRDRNFFRLHNKLESSCYLRARVSLEIERAPIGWKAMFYHTIKIYQNDVLLFYCRTFFLERKLKLCAYSCNYLRRYSKNLHIRT